jgi:membrane associated rhomboid family serine protease
VDRPNEGAGDPAPPQSERTSGLTLDTCYRHPDVQTGVHCTRCGRPICPDCMTQAPVGYQCPHCAGEGASGRRQVRPITARRIPVARVLLFANVAMFVVEVAIGSASLFQGPGIKTLFDLGALQPIAIAQGGQYWRLFTAMFLHANLLHLGLNMYGLYLFGYLVEDILGRAAFVVLYFLSGLLASVTSYAFGNPGAVAVGASGAIFGMLGAWIAYNYRRRGTALGSANLRGAALIVALNLFLGFSIAGVDNLAHLGGLVTGVICGLTLEGVGKRGSARVLRVGILVALAAVGVALTVWRTSALSGASLSG